MTINPFILHGEEVTPVRKLLYLKAFAGGGALSEYEITGNPVAFATNVQKPLSAFTIPFLPVQSGTGDPSPENVRPISGWTGVTANRAGKNLFDESSVIFGKWVSADGRETNNQNCCLSPAISFVPGAKLTLWYNGNQPYSAAIVEYDADMNFIVRDFKQWMEVPTEQVFPLVVTLNSSTRYSKLAEIPYSA